MNILTYMLNVHGLVYNFTSKTYINVSSRYLSDMTKEAPAGFIEAGEQVETSASLSTDFLDEKNAITKEEHEFAVLLDMIAPGILPLNESVLLEPVPDVILDKIFSKDVKFSEKVSALKPYFGQPFRPALVEEMPSSTSPVVKHSPDKKEAIELLYVMRCISAIFPETADELTKLAKEAFSGDERNFDRSKITDVIEYLRKLRGASAPVSSVAAAALKLFYTVDGMAFDDFSVSLNALEWEQITVNMNETRIKYAEKIREYSTEEYHMKTSKESKIADKLALDEKIDNARIKLVRIMKLTLEDLHYQTQLKITSRLDFKGSLKKVRYDRKHYLSAVKSAILREYRKTPDLDIKKYAKGTIISV